MSRPIRARDLEADLAICEAATPEKWVTRPCGCGDCDLHFLNVAHSEGRLEPQDARFIANAREGWPYAIRRAMEAEEQVDRLRDELNILQEQWNERGGRFD